MPVQLRVAAPTWARFEAACEALGAHPDDVLAGEVEPGAVLDEASPPAAARLLDALAQGGRPEGERPEQLAGPVAHAFFSAARAAQARASARTKRYADRCGVWEVLQAQSGAAGAAPMARVIAGFPPVEGRALREMGLEELLSFFGLRAVSEISDNLDEYL